MIVAVKPQCAAVSCAIVASTTIAIAASVGAFMRSLFAIVATVAMLGSPALAADMALKAPPPAFDWTGFYAGGFVGGAGTGPLSTPDATNAVTVGVFAPGVPLICDGGTPGLKTGCVASYNMAASVIAGGTAGYNWQIGKLITGLEGEVGYLHLSGSGPLPFIAGTPCGSAANPCLATMSSTIGDAYGALMARFGVTANALNPNWPQQVLIFAKIGAAVTREATTEAIAAFAPVPAFALTGATNVWGVAAGGGVEWAIDRHWSVKAEYEYLGFNKTVGACGVLPPQTAGAGGTWCTQTSIGPVQTGKVGFNYRFDWAELAGARK